MSDGESKNHVIAACRRGDREAFRVLFETHKDRVYSIALYFFNGDETAAADVTQQIFLKLFDSIKNFREDAEFTTWLYRLVANLCTDEHRKRRRFLSFGDAASLSTKLFARGSQEDAYSRVEVSDAVKNAIAALKPKLRIAILLKHFEELSYDEMADVLGCSKGTIASRLNRGHQILARKLAHLRHHSFSSQE